MLRDTQTTNELHSLYIVMAPTSLTRFKHALAIRLAALASMLALFACARRSRTPVFTVRQSFTVRTFPAGAKSVRGWFWMPEDRPEQHVMEFRVTEAPQSFPQSTRDPRYGRSWIYAEAGGDKPLRVVTEFKVLRHKSAAWRTPRRLVP